MPSAFADLWSGLQPIVDAQWGEPVQIVPQIENSGSKYFRRGDDTSQQPRDVTGIFRDSPIVDTVKGSGANTHENVDVLTRRTSVDFDQELFIGFPMPAEGWIIVATSQPQMPRYVVATVEPDGISRVFCKVTFLDYASS